MDYGANNLAQASEKMAAFSPGGYVSGAGVGQATAPTPAIPTLVRALSSIEDLNKRLYALCSQTQEIAQAVGGPFPVPAGSDKADMPSSAMQRLNDSLTMAHGTVTSIENALAAMRRALGA